MAKDEEEEPAEIAWEGDSLEVLRGFPKAIKKDKPKGFESCEREAS